MTALIGTVSYPYLISNLEQLKPMNRSPSLELSQVYSGMKATGDPNTGSIGDGSRRQAVGTDSGEDGRISTGAIVLAGSDVLLPPSQASSTKQLIESKHGTVSVR